MHILFDLANVGKEQPSLTVSDISAITGLKKQQIVFPKNEHFFNNEAAYLIHAADPFKALYASDELLLSVKKSSSNS